MAFRTGSTGFGDRGNFQFKVGGVPFRFQHDGTEEEALAAFKEELGVQFEANPNFIEAQARDLGLSGGSMTAFRAGRRREASKAIRGAQQAFAEMAGDTETATQLGILESEDAALFKVLDDQSRLGAEDLGQLAAWVPAFIAGGEVALVSKFGPPVVRALTTFLSKASAPSIGAFLGATQPVAEGETPHRGLGAILGVVGAKVGDIAIGTKHLLGRGLQGIKTWRLNRRLGGTNVGVNMPSPGVIFGGEGGAQVIEEGAKLAANTRPVPRAIGQALLRRSEQIVDNAPPSMVKDAVFLGKIRIARNNSIIREAADENARVLNPGKFVDALDEVQNRTFKALGDVLEKEMKALKSVMVHLDELGMDVAEEYVEAIAHQVLTAPLRSKPMLDAVRRASNPTAARIWLDRLLDQATVVANASLQAAGVQAAVSQEGVDVTIETADKILDTVFGGQ